MAATPSRTPKTGAADESRDDVVSESSAETGALATRGGDFGLTEDSVRRAIQTARASAEEAKRALEALELEAMGKFGDTQKQVEAAIREKPMQAAGIAFAAGVLATLFLRGRR